MQLSIIDIISSNKEGNFFSTFNSMCKRQLQPYYEECFGYTLFIYFIDYSYELQIVISFQSYQQMLEFIDLVLELHVQLLRPLRVSAHWRTCRLTG